MESRETWSWDLDNRLGRQRTSDQASIGSGDGESGFNGTKKRGNRGDRDEGDKGDGDRRVGVSCYG